LNLIGARDQISASNSQASEMESYSEYHRS
jgi:hypothetical protein